MTVITDKLAQEIRVGDVDTALVLRLYDMSDNVWNSEGCVEPPPLDVSGATPMTGIKMIFEKPDGTVIEVGATFATSIGLGDGTDGYIEYKTVAGFLDVEGRWQRQGKVTIGAGVWKTQIVQFRVFPNLS